MDNITQPSMRDASGLVCVPALAYRVERNPDVATKLPAIINNGGGIASMIHDLCDPARECFVAVYLTAKGEPMAAPHVVSMGTLTASLVHPREVFAPALMLGAAAVVVAHNHPSGDPTPSAEDRATTRRLQRAARLLGFELLDHVVVTKDGYRSFLEEGWL